ncbi:MAG: TPM domain-containing protein [Oscillospiraceae bacterium]|nr:TPM domain-containing protein [Oscillospiraceae bacterium]
MKKIVCLLLFAVMLIVLSAGALAAQPRVNDEAGLLEDGEIEKLERKLEKVFEDHDFELAILTAESTRGKSVEAFADDYYDENGYGYGLERDGALIVVSMAERDVYISTAGSGQRIFTDYGIDYVLDDVAGYLSDGDYYRAFNAFIEDSEELLEQAEGGEAYDIDNPIDGYEQEEYYSGSYQERSKGSRVAGKLIPAAIVSFLISLLVVGGMKRKMNTAVKHEDARDYVRPGSFVLTRQRDTFLYCNVTRVRRQTDDDRGGRGGHGGSSIHFSSSGISHGGGGRKF